MEDRIILVVDDDAEVRAMTRELLEAAGYPVFVAGGGLDALALVGAHPGDIHLLLTDVGMPGMSGPELVRRLVEVRPGIAVLYMSGQTPSPSDVGARSWLVKPFTEAALLAAIRQALAR